MIDTNKITEIFRKHNMYLTNYDYRIDIYSGTEITLEGIFNNHDHFEFTLENIHDEKDLYKRLENILGGNK